MAYTSNESGGDEVYVQSFPEAGGKWRISNRGGAYPHWRRDGKELFYLAADWKLMAVEVKGGASFEAGAPNALLDARMNELTSRDYAVTGDGQRFLLNAPVEEATTRPMTVVSNWTAEVKR